MGAWGTSEYLGLLELLAEVILQPEVDDLHIWQFSLKESIKLNLPTRPCLLGWVNSIVTLGGDLEELGPWQMQINHVVGCNKCGTTDQLTRRGLPHPERCPLCDQVGETIDDPLVSCVFTRQVWFRLLQSVCLHILAPQPAETSFDDRWDKAIEKVSNQVKKGLNFVVILVAWSAWNHCNRCVFNGVPPDLNGIYNAIKEELRLWSLNVLGQVPSEEQLGSLV